MILSFSFGALCFIYNLVNGLKQGLADTKLQTCDKTFNKTHGNFICLAQVFPFICPFPSSIECFQGPIKTKILIKAD